jgi:hypothetical protein
MRNHNARACMCRFKALIGWRIRINCPKRPPMYIVEIRLETSELTEIMAAMRIWLDQRRFEPSVFAYSDSGIDAEVSIAFKMAGEAEAFARHFDGRVKDAALAPPDDEPKLVGVLQMA